MKEIKLYKSNWKIIKLMLLSSIFVGLGIWGLVTNIKPNLIWWLNIGFFGLSYPLGIFHLLDRKPQIIINQIGIFDKSIYHDFINWELIEDAYPIDIFQQKFICLRVSENFKPSKKRNKLYENIVRLNKIIGGQELNLNLGQIDIDVVKLTIFINLMRAASPEEKQNVILGKLIWNI